MTQMNDIFEASGKAQYNVPEGYFDSLKERLDEIPSIQRRFSVTPYLALAASFVAIFIAGSLLLKITAGSDKQDEEQAFAENYLENLAPVTQQTDDLLHLTAEAEEESFNDEDIIEYLIESGTSTESLDYTDR